MVDGIWKYGDGRDDRIRNIKNGLTDLGMPGFGDSLTDDQIKAIVTFMERTKKTMGQPKPSPSDSIQTLDYEVDIDIWVEGLKTPWAIDFIDAHTALITERVGALRMVKNGGLLADPIAGTPKVLHGASECGLMDNDSPSYPAPRYGYQMGIRTAKGHCLPPRGGGAARA